MNVNELIDTYKKEITEITELKNEKYIDDKCLETAVCWIERFVEDLKDLSTIEYNRKVKIPKFVADWLNDLDVGYLLPEKIKYLIMSHDGDEYYFCDMMVNDSIMSLELADKMYRYSQKESVGNLLQLINGYEVEEEPKYYVALPHFGFMTSSQDYPFTDYKEDAAQSTENEIKELDERYWAFAVPVEEVNNG